MIQLAGRAVSTLQRRSVSSTTATVAEGARETSPGCGTRHDPLHSLCRLPSTKKIFRPLAEIISPSPLSLSTASFSARDIAPAFARP